jgi:2-dehydropantoate 2-reductase
MRIAVVGRAWSAATSGGELAHAGEDVVFLARGASLHAIPAYGLQVESVDSNFAVRRRALEVG